LYSYVYTKDGRKKKNKNKTFVLLRKEAVNIIEVKFDVSTKAKSLNKAMENIPDNYDGVIILDADNLMDFNFIKIMNNAMDSGCKAIQGHRIAKNLNTSFAVLDAISEEVNNHIFRQGHRALGLSSALIGSGMAFEYQLFKNYMAGIDSHAEDKELEIKLLSNNHKIEYIENAYVLDEKVSRSDVFLKQRSRWIANQMLYARRYFLKALASLFKGNIDYFDKVFQFFLPPRVILLGLTYLLFLLSAIFNPFGFFLGWLTVFVFVNLAIITSVPRRFFSKGTLKHLLRLPQGFLLMVLSILNFKEARKSFNPTPHFTEDKEDDEIK
jgi:cellulose synthase/poly-beta-1,6-N-acetylglucosamine synthase-like glycosyltransferase